MSVVLRLVNPVLEPSNSKYGSQASSISIIQELVRNAESRALAQTSGIRTRLLARLPQCDVYAN